MASHSLKRGSVTRFIALPHGCQLTAPPLRAGTNDYGHNHDTGPAWEKNFTDCYVAFMKNLTIWHKSPSLPIFCAAGPLTAKPDPQIQAAIAAFNAAGGNATFLPMHTQPGSDG